ncbi:hypothetical protein FACS1894188_12580 [Clostridia bacterium]|nr:hypothetical protein FACS1894188_12580 [Clostridia bacterium]
MLEDCEKTILEYEKLMYKFEFHNVMSLLDTFIRNSNKYWSKNMDTGNERVLTQTLADAFHLLRVGCVLLHPVAPVGTELITEYLNLSPREFCDWTRIFDDIYSFYDDKSYALKELPQKFDFFRKLDCQF